MPLAGADIVLADELVGCLVDVGQSGWKEMQQSGEKEVKCCGVDVAVSKTVVFANLHSSASLLCVLRLANRALT